MRWRFGRLPWSLMGGGVAAVPDRIVAMPRLTGPAIPGLVGHAHGFPPIDAHCAVPGTDRRVFAAGDATAFPIKHGRLAAQRADTAAAVIAQRAGAGTEAAPFPHRAVASC